MEKLVVSTDLIGKYINQYLWSDVNPVGKIIAIKGKTKVLIQRVEAGENKRMKDMTFVQGGFVGTYIDQYKQDYDFQEQGEPYWATLSKTGMKRRFWSIADAPCKFYDYNF
jgi:hypothetical protein